MAVEMIRRKKYLIKKIVFIIILIAIQIEIHSQEINLEKKISIVVKEKPLGEILKEIELKGQLNFSYSNQQIDVNQKFSMVSRRKTISQIFAELFSEADIEYVKVEKQIILKPIKGNLEEDNILQDENKKCTLHGYVKDNETGEALIGANISIKGKLIGTLTNSYGFFSITLPSGFYTFEFTYLGYQNKELSINLKKDTLSIQNLKLDERKLELIVISASENADIKEMSPLKKTQISPLYLSTKVGISGDADLIQMLQSIPGIHSQSDGSVFFFTRGGNKDQNLILIDDAPIYNPSHIFGFFSTISPDAINSVDIYKNYFPIQYGGRLSSIVDIRTKDGNINNFELNGNINALTKSLDLEGPLFKHKASYYIGFRSSNVNWMNNLLVSNRRTYFADVHAKLNFRINKKNKIFFSFYFGGDNIKQFETGYSSFAIKWQNVSGTLRWNHLFSDRLFSNSMIYSSLYNYYLYTNVEKNQYWNSLIGNISIKSDFTEYLNSQNTYRFGILINNQYFNPGNLNDKYFTRKVSASSALEAVLYFGHEYRINKNLLFNYGIRMICWNNIGPTTRYIFNNYYNPTDTINYSRGIFNTYLNFEPRLDLNYSFNKSNLLKLSFNRNIQNLHQLSNSISPFTSLDIWMPSSPNIKPQVMNQYVLAYNKKYTEYDFSIEAYCKQMYNQIEYVDNANMLLNPLIEGQLRFGESNSYGIEFTLQKSKGNLTWLINYSYSKVLNKVKDINANRTYPAYYDKPHQINFSLSIKANKRWRFNTNWVFSSGSRFTAPSGFYNYNGYLVPYYSNKNNAQLPYYHRLDVSATFVLNKKETSLYIHSLSFTIVNLYGRKNPISVNFNKVETSDGNFVIPSNYITENQIIPTSIYLLGIAPSISYKFCFRTKNN